MKTRKFLWAVLPMMAAALAMTACGGDDVADTKPVPVSPTDKTDVTQKSVPYTVTVTGDPETTRATTEGLLMKFADGDQLYVQNAAGDIHGVLTIDEGIGNGYATFSGDLYYEESNPPTTLTSLTATLVSNNDKVAVITDGKVTGFTYPTENNVCSTLADAVSQYSQLTGTANYGSTFTLTQSTAFLKFTVNLEDGTKPTDDAVTVSVTKDGSTILGTGTTVASGTEQFVDVQAVFYVPVPYNTTITTDANMWVGSVGTPDDESITYGGTASKTLSGGKVYNITKSKEFVRLWANGPVFSSRNLCNSTTGFTSSVTDYGDYYCWGGTTPVTDTSINLNWNSDCPYWLSGTYYLEVKFSKYVPTDQADCWGGDGAPDDKLVLEPADDVATVKLGSSWRMPTNAEFNESTGLLAYTTNAWLTVNSVNGRTFTGKDSYAGKAIFFPAAGYRNGASLYYQDQAGNYWSSSLNTSNPRDAFGFNFASGAGAAYTVIGSRFYGEIVRPVRAN